MGQIIIPKPKNPVLVLPSKRKAKRRTKGEWLEKFAAVPQRTESAEETAKQRSLFERHDTVAVSIRLPLAPTANNYKAVFQPPRGRARLILTAEARAYFEAVEKVWKKHFDGKPPQPLTGRIRLLLTFCFARRGSDISNRIKATEDALTNCGAWLDDEQIDDGGQHRGPVDPTGHGYCDVIIETIGE